MEILIVLVIMIAAVIWVKMKCPEAAITKYIDVLYNRIKPSAKPSEPDTATPVVDTHTNTVEMVEPVVLEPVSDAEQTQTESATAQDPIENVETEEAVETPANAVEMVEPVVLEPVSDAEQTQTESATAQDPIETVEAVETPVAEIINEETTPVEPAATSATSPQIPEDSVLKRHYLATLAAERNAITHPYPTDSILRRHYESLQTSYLQK
jgi:hypothetical protein